MMTFLGDYPRNVAQGSWSLHRSLVIGPLGVIFVAILVPFGGNRISVAAESAPALQYREYDPGGHCFVEMLPARGNGKTYGTVYDVATGEALWIVPGYSPAVRLYAHGARLLVLGRGVVGDAAAGELPAIAFFHHGDLVRRYSVGELVEQRVVADSKQPGPQTSSPQTPSPQTLSSQTPSPAGKQSPFAWLAKVIGFSPDGKQFSITLANGAIVAFDAETGEIVKKGPAQPQAAEPERRIFAGGYDQAREARECADWTNGFTWRLYQRALVQHESVAGKAPAGNFVLAPGGVEAALALVMAGAKGATAEEIGMALAGASFTPDRSLATEVGQLAAVVLDGGPGPPTKDRKNVSLGLELAEDDKGGVLVKAVANDSPLAGLVQAGGHVLRVQEREVRGLGAFYAALAGSADNVELTIAGLDGSVRHLFLPGAANLPTVRTDTALWVDRRDLLSEKFRQVVEASGLGAICPADFSDREALAARINNSIAAATNGRLVRLMSAADCAKNDRLLVTNTFYFRGKWKVPFDPAKTLEKGEFQVSAGTTVTVPIMCGSGFFALGKDPRTGASFLELPYKTDKFALVVVLPEKADGLANLEAGLTPAQLEAGLAALDAAPLRKVLVRLPRFSVRTRQSLGPALVALGIRRAFDASQADLSGILPQRGLYLGTVLQEAYFTADERGSEAAAATLLRVAAIGIEPEPATFYATRPFLFLLRDRSSGAVLFAGRFTNPGGPD